MIKHDTSVIWTPLPAPQTASFELESTLLRRTGPGKVEREVLESLRTSSDWAFRGDAWAPKSNVAPT